MSERDVDARCPACGSDLVVPYVMLGAPVECPSCGETVVPTMPVGSAYPKTRYEITYLDFQQLLGYDYRTDIGELLARWFDYGVTGEEGSTVVLSSQGEPVDLLDLHLRIQQDPAKQRELYRVAMGLWR